MDPYLEQFWPDLHARLILYACDQLEEQLPSNLIARVEERVVLETEEDPHGVYPDVKITERPGRGFEGGRVAGQAAVIEPVIVPYRGELATETFLNVLEAGPGQRLITVIEFLSLANKLAGPGQRQYRRKQHELADARVSLVEIDLLRQGRRVLNVPPSRIPRGCGPPTRRVYGGDGGRSSARSTPLPCATRCRRSASRFAKRTRTYGSICKPSSSKPTARAATT
jgi:hypothetical protein